jgi:multiple sugar transport system permease protein
MSETAQPSFWKKNQRALAPWLFLAPGMIMFLIYVIYPIFQSVNLSFYEWDGMGEKTYVGVQNYVELLDDDSFYTSLWNNLIWLVYKSLFFFPFVISQVVVGLIFTWFYAPGFGILPHVFNFFTGTPTAILADKNLATYGVIAAGLWPQTAYCMILYLTGLNNISPDQVEAARMDNAKGWSMLWHIILPQLRPATFIAMVVTIIGALRSFDLISIMTVGGPGGATRVLSYFMYEKSFSEYGFAMGYGAAIAVVLFAIMLVFISLFIVRMLSQERNS